jgi:hypothetical protein
MTMTHNAGAIWDGERDCKQSKKLANLVDFYVAIVSFYVSLEFCCVQGRADHYVKCFPSEV